MGDDMLLFDQTLKKIDFIFRYGGFNIKNGDISSEEYNMKSRLIYIINFFWLNMEMAACVNWFIDGVTTGKDFLSLTYIAPCISLSTLGNLKGLFLILNEKHVHKLAEKLRDLEKKEKQKPQTNEKEENMNVERDFLNKVINVTNWLGLVLILTFVLSPLVKITVNYYKTGELNLILPFFALYPFDALKIKVWPFVYLHQTWAADYFFFICCTYIRIQFKQLQHTIENIIPIRNINHNFLDDDEFKAKFRDVVKWHQDLIESVDILEIIYSKSTLYNFVSSSMILCLTGFNVTKGNDISYVVTFLSFLFISLFQVFSFCFIADLLMTDSMEIADAIYRSQWYMAEKSIGKKLLIIQTRGLEPCKLTAFGFADVNLKTFMRVLSTAWSFFALLQTIYGGN